jgi:Fe-S-cluster containining protein
MVRAWACKKRGLCCKFQLVQIDEVERKRIRRKIAEDPGEGGEYAELGEALSDENVERIDGWPTLPRKESNCGFLGADSLCGLRKRYGDSVYPQVCKKFPYLSMLTPDRHLFDLSFQCPTALELLATETDFRVDVEPEGEPPVERVAFLTEDRECFDLQGQRISVTAFWDLHWSLFERFRARPESNPTERLLAFAEEVTGEEAASPAVLRRDIWRRGAFEPSVERELLRLAGEVPEGLHWLWIWIAPQDYTLDLLPEPRAEGLAERGGPSGLDEEAVFMRYLLHRFHCPVFYISQPNPRFLLSTFFAMIARYRIERARGFDVLGAIRQLDRFFIHTSNPGAIFGTESTFPSWRAMASLARAVAVG